MSLAFSRPQSGSVLATQVVRHAEWNKARDAILESLSDPAGAPIVLALGVPGFGKTKLAEDVAAEVATARLAEMRADPNHVPVVSIPAYAPDAGRSFGWRETFVSILAELNERGIEHRTGDAFDPAGMMQRRSASQRTRSERQLQSDVIEALNFHTTVVLLIDEIEHIAYQKDEARFEASADILKTITNETGVRIVATGSYEGLGFRSVSGQLMRRMRPIHLRRYRADLRPEFAEYKRVVIEMLRLVGCEDEPEALIPILYRQSLGAVGTTADVLMRAEHALLTHRDSLLHGITRNSRSEADLAKVAHAIVDAEKAFEPDLEARTKLDELIGLARASSVLLPSTKKGNGQKRALRPGRRAPSRDRVGAPRRCLT